MTALSFFCTPTLLDPLYPLLYRLEKHGWVSGRWVEKAGERRRRFYRLTAAGRKVLGARRGRPRTNTAAAVLLVVTAVACLIPARRATRVDPVTALRLE